MAKKTNIRSADFMLPVARGAYLYNLLKLRDRDKGEPTYGCVLLWPKGTDLSELERNIEKVAVEKWGAKARQWIKDELIHSPILDGDSKSGLNSTTGERHKGHAGHLFVRASANIGYEPEVWDARKNKIRHPAELISGSWVLPLVNVYEWENNTGGKGITVGVIAVQIVRKAVGDDVLGNVTDRDTSKYFNAIDTADAQPITHAPRGAAEFFS